MRVLVCGGRYYPDRAQVFHVLDEVGPVDWLISGGATGADQWAFEWALETETFFVIWPADWSRYGRRAGPIRNHNMADLKPTLGIAFPGGSGTASMVTILEADGVEVLR